MSELRRALNQYSFHPKDTHLCFICDKVATTNSCIPPRSTMCDDSTELWRISLCASHGVFITNHKNLCTSLEATLKLLDYQVKPENRIEGYEVNDFCRLTPTDVVRGYVVHPSVNSTDCFYCTNPSNNHRDKSPSDDQLKLSANYAAPRYVMPCCVTCGNKIRLEIPEVVDLEHRAKFIQDWIMRKVRRKSHVL